MASRTRPQARAKRRHRGAMGQEDLVTKTGDSRCGCGACGVGGIGAAARLVSARLAQRVAAPECHRPAGGAPPEEGEQRELALRTDAVEQPIACSDSPDAYRGDAPSNSLPSRPSCAARGATTWISPLATVRRLTGGRRSTSLRNSEACSSPPSSGHLASFLGLTPKHRAGPGRLVVVGAFV
jgi:hypothetical protein